MQSEREAIVPQAFTLVTVVRRGREMYAFISPFPLLIFW
jgi:hypothetical protein